MNPTQSNNGSEDSLKEGKVTVEQFYDALLMCIWAPVNLLTKENQDLLGLFSHKKVK